MIFHDSASLAREYMHTYIILTWNLKNEHLEEEIPFEGYHFQLPREFPYTQLYT